MGIAANVGLGAIGLAGAGAGGAAAHAVYRSMAAHEQQQLDATAREQRPWMDAFDREFPDRRVDTPQDHARLDAFLERNPKPDTILLDADNRDEIGVTQLSGGTDEAGYSFGLPTAMLGAGLGGGGWMVAARTTSHPALRGLGALGAGAGVALGVGAFAGMFAMPTKASA